MTAALAACSSSSPTAKPTLPPPTPTATPTVAPTPTPKLYTNVDMTVGFIQTGSESAWRDANTQSFKETAVDRGITLKLYDAQGKIDNQMKALTQFTQDPAINVIVLAPIATTGYDAALKAAQAAGKLVIIESRPIDSDPSLYYTYVGSDYHVEGQKAAAAMCTLLANSNKKNVVVIGGDPASYQAIDRARGINEGTKDCAISITAMMADPNWDPTTAKTIMTSFLKQSKDIQGVIAGNDAMAISAIQVINSSGKKAGKNIFVVGFDATIDGFKYLISGQLGADIECNPLLAPQVFDAALKGLNGDATVPKFTPANESQFYAFQGATSLQQIMAGRKY
jgi:simple sugar transport system substrate-binding protein